MNKKSVYLIHYSTEQAFACYNESNLDRKVLVETSVALLNFVGDEEMVHVCGLIDWLDLNCLKRMTLKKFS